MNRLIDPPAIKIAVQRMVCTGCGAEANASCTCGVAYTPKSVRAAEAIKANPEKSNRAIAADIGVDHKTVGAAREAGGESFPTTDTRVGRDGKNYPATAPQKPRLTSSYIPAQNVTPPPDFIAQAQKHLDAIVPLLRRMDQRERLTFRRVALQRMSDAFLDDPDQNGESK
jgi:hypothetical protein